MKARTLLKKLTTYGIVVQVVNDKVRLSPSRLINDKVLAFVRDHKNDLMCALYEEHQEKKRALNQDRLHVLRCLIHRYLKPSKSGHIVPADHEIEEYIDGVLRGCDFDLEDAITTYRKITIEPILVCECGYRPPFCSCGGISDVRLVACDSCEHFIIDGIGDGTGIGRCNLGVQWTQELKGHVPLYRYTKRHCDSFRERDPDHYLYVRT